jgi:hypothetical protein
MQDTFLSETFFSLFLTFLENDYLRVKKRAALYRGKRGSGWGRNRTADTRIFSPLLCQLSYPAVASTLRQEVHYASFPKSGKRLLFSCGTGTTVVGSGRHQYLRVAH